MTRRTDSGFSDIPFDRMTRTLLSLARSGPLAVLIHARPDGDCVGSGFALAALLASAGCKARVICPDPMPERLAFLDVTGQGDILPPAEGEPFGPGSRAVSVDVAAPALFGGLDSKYNVLLGIDHHESSTAVSDRYNDPSAAAAGEIVWRIAKNWLRTGVIETISHETAYASYAAISSDTGCFRFPNVTPSTHRIAAQLLSEVPEHAEIDRRLFEIKTPGRIAAEKMALDLLKVSDGGKISLCAISADMIREAGLEQSELDALTDVARSVDGVAVAIAVREEKPGVFRVSLRSNGNADVSEICSGFGGGGHKRAAGCTIHAASVDDAANSVLGAVRRALCKS